MLAIEAAAVAAQMSDAHCRHIMMELAITYDRLAGHAETHELPLPPEADRKMPLASDEAERWGDRAENARTMAGRLIDRDAQQMMQRVADIYNDLAAVRREPSAQDKD